MRDKGRNGLRLILRVNVYLIGRGLLHIAQRLHITTRSVQFYVLSVWIHHGQNLQASHIV